MLLALTMGAFLQASLGGMGWLSDTLDRPRPLALFVALVVTPAGLFAAGVLTAAAVGGGRLRSPLAAGVALVVAFSIVVNGAELLAALRLPSDRNDVVVALVLVLAPAGIVAMAATRRDANPVRISALLAVAAVLAVLAASVTASNAVIVGWTLGLSAWVVLPAVAVGLQKQEEHR